MTWVSSKRQNGHFILYYFSYTGKREVRAITLPLTSSMLSSFSGCSKTSAINCATSLASSSLKPRVVIAGVPSRIPDVTKGLSGSLGIELSHIHI